MTGRSLGSDPTMQRKYFGGASALLPLWLAEPSVDIAAPIQATLIERASQGWFGYEVRPDCVGDAFWTWMKHRHGWSREGLHQSVSPSVGTSIGVLLEQTTQRGDGVILQPPVYTGFSPLIVSAGRRPVKNPLRLTDDGYRMDFEDLATKAADPGTRALILCNPHNPVGRLWTREELAELARICAAHDVFVISDEIHADLVLGQAPFTPLATVAANTGVRWAATHGPIKSLGVAGLCDSLTISSHEDVIESFLARCRQLHLIRHHVFGVAAFETAYQEGGPWLDQLLDTVRSNLALLRSGLPDRIRLMPAEGTYLAWLDCRELGLDAPALAEWLSARAGLALSPGHWFGREGAGFARMTVAVPADWISTAIDRLHKAITQL